MTKNNSKKKQLPTSLEFHPMAKRLSLWSLATLHVVCPLLFFTNLTRNPYYSQIALLNIVIAFLGLVWIFETWRSGTWQLPRLSFEIPLAVFLVIALMSTVLSWSAHPSVRPGILYEGIRVWTFTLVNSCMALYLPMIFTKPTESSKESISIWTDISLAALWGLMWFGFFTMKNPNKTDLIWDPYGAFLWALAFVYAVVRIKNGEAQRIFHVIFAVTMVAGCYGLMQYMGRDIIWSSLVQPYGGRPVSTFGNPNFLSTYLMLVSPLAFVFGLNAKGKQAWGYYLVCLISVLSVMGTLTRSTYVGLLAIFLFLAVILYKPEHKTTMIRALIVIVGVCAFVFLFPSSPVRISQSPLARFIDIYDHLKDGLPYAPWHQRILIWSSAWDMVQERFWMGKGWGTFELFYPYYQGGWILNHFLAVFRTHANNAHNILMEIWAQVGLVGTGAALWLLIGMFAAGWVIFKRKAEGMSRYLTAGLLAGLVGIVTDNFFGNVSIFFAVPAFLFWWNMGSLNNETDQIRFVRRPVSVSVGRPLLVLGAIFCLAVMVYFGKRWKQEVYYFQGFKAAKAGHVEASYKYLEKAFDWFEGEVNSNYELGNSYARFASMLQKKKLNDQAIKYKKKAAEAYEASLAANPGYDEIFFNLGVTFAQLNEREKAYSKLKTAIFINPLLRDGYASLGNLYVQDKKFKEARDVFENALLSFPKDKEIWLNLGFIYIEIGKKGEALKNNELAFEAFKNAYKLDPNYQPALRNLTLISQKLGRNEPLVEIPRLVKEMEDFVRQRNYEPALRRARQIAELIPNSADAHLSLGNVLYYMKQYDQAIREIQKALKLNPRFPTAQINLGKIYQATGKLSLARQNYQEVLRYAPKNAEAQGLLNALPR